MLAFVHGGSKRKNRKRLASLTARVKYFEASEFVFSYALSTLFANFSVTSAIPSKMAAAGRIVCAGQYISLKVERAKSHRTWYLGLTYPYFLQYPVVPSKITFIAYAIPSYAVCQ